MNLATRCHACGTVFRVVRDQLRVSEGWVRCGRCMAVFNATDDLFELDADEAQAPAPTTAAPGETARRVRDELDADRRHWQAQAHAMPAAWTQAVRPAEGLHDEVSAQPPDEPAAVVADPSGGTGAWAPTPDRPAVDTVPDWTPDDTDAGRGATPALEPAFRAETPAVPADDGRPAVIVSWAPDTADAPAFAATDVGAASLDDAAGTPSGAMAGTADAAGLPGTEATAALPSFVRRAERAAFWRRPRMRVALGVLTALLALALAAQVGHATRDLLAAQFPALTPTLQTLCDVSGCRIAPLRRIDRLSVDSAGLTLVPDAPLYRLQVVLHNRADTALLAPALDLSLEDAQGVVVTRRVLQGAELGLASPVIAAGAQLPLTVTLQARDRRIAGYHVELFYP